jgi:predicted choloylglycine hydrolase
MTTDGSKEPGRSPGLGAEQPVPSDWRGWMRWAASQNWADPDNWRQFLVPWDAAPQLEAPLGGVEVTWRSFAEVEPGPAFATHWADVGPPLERWWLSDGRGADHGDATQARTQLRRHMPELEPVWDGLVEMAGGTPLAATILTLWNPPPFLTGCSQAVVSTGGPALVRNYDWDFRLFDAAVASTGYLGRRVVGTEDCGWGLLDGINDAGLAVSLTFGGRPEVGEGFGIPLVLRYLLQTCGGVEDAVAALLRIPVHMSYNITVTDPTGRVATVYVGPDRPAWATDADATTNHQEVVEWRPYCDAIRSQERLTLLREFLDDGDDVAAVTAALLRAPLYATEFHRGFGTLYTAVARPKERSITYHWPGREPWTHVLDEPRTDEVVVTLGGSRSWA